MTIQLFVEIQAEYQRLQHPGVAFHSPPPPMGSTVIAALDDTCGNLIQIYQAG